MTKLTYLDLTGNWFTGWHLSLCALAVKCLLANQRLMLPVMCACSASDMHRTSAPRAAKHAFLWPAH